MNVLQLNNYQKEQNLTPNHCNTSTPETDLKTVAFGNIGLATKSLILMQREASPDLHWLLNHDMDIYFVNGT